MADFGFFWLFRIPRSAPKKSKKSPKMVQRRTILARLNALCSTIAKVAKEGLEHASEGFRGFRPASTADVPPGQEAQEWKQHEHQRQSRQIGTKIIGPAGHRSGTRGEGPGVRDEVRGLSFRDQRPAPFS